MDNTDRPDVNAPEAHSPTASPRPEADPGVSHDRPTSKATKTKSRRVLSQLAGRSWQILLLWLVISAPISFLVYVFVKPSYEASSLVRVERTEPEILDSLNKGSVENPNSKYLQTQLGLITSARVLDPALADPLVVNLPMVKRSENPKRDLLAKLRVVTIDKTNLIRVSLELPNPQEAVTIVRAVVQSYLVQSKSNQDKYRVVLVDPAFAPRMPSRNKRLVYMADAPAVALFLLLGLFLAQEINAGRNAAARSAHMMD